MSEHAAWMRVSRSLVLEEIRERVQILCDTRRYGWESRPHEKIGDMIARLEWLQNPEKSEDETH